MNGWHEGFEPVPEGSAFRGCMVAGCFTAALVVVILVALGWV